MYECDICCELYINININILSCCKGKRICSSCRVRYDSKICPFCRQKMNPKPAIVIINKNFPYKGKGDIILSIMNYNVIKI